MLLVIDTDIMDVCGKPPETDTFACTSLQTVSCISFIITAKLADAADYLWWLQRKRADESQPLAHQSILRSPV